jgi:AcrR family transcriptional regulator
MASPTTFAERQSEILHEALFLIQEAGLRNLTMRKIAERVGFSEAAIYRYFPSKADLITAISHFYRDQFVTPVRELIQREDLTALEKLETLWHRNLDVHIRLKGLPSYHLAEMSAAADPANKDLIKSTIQEYQSLLEKLLAEIVPPELGPKPREVAIMMIGVQTAFSLWGSLLDDPDLATRIHQELIPFCIESISGGRPRKEAAG